MTQQKPHILITNDDGIHAPGIRHLWQALHEIADLTIVAPASEQSAMSLAVTLRTPIRIEKIHWPHSTNAWSVTGTPVDCVKLGLSVILDRAPDLIVSGINRGNNAGRNVLYSGTVAAVIEGVMRNVPGIAFSCLTFQNPKYHVAEKHIPAIVQHVLKNPLPDHTFLNVNFPDHAEHVEGFKLTRQGKSYWMENPDKRDHPAEGHSYYWMGAKVAEFDEHEESDIAWLKRGYVTGVPIHLPELTHHQLLAERKAHFDVLF